MKPSYLAFIVNLAIAIIGYFTLPAQIFSPATAFAVGAAVATCLYLFILMIAPSRSPMMDQASKTIYVGNLPYRANENDVKNLFSLHGEVFAVRLMKDKRTGKRRGFGFVVMAAADAENAIAALSNSEYGQRTLKVRIANDPRSEENLD
ncbi:RNA recognition motif domain-containing protein [Vibrio stylophorae]|nr:RNA-binding protein [Vibrio stylophorae]